MKDRNPITSESEAIKVREYLIKTTCDILKIDREEATKRVYGLFKSGILEGGNPDNPDSQMKIEAFLSIPSEKYSHLL